MEDKSEEVCKNKSKDDPTCLQCHYGWYDYENGNRHPFFPLTVSNVFQKKPDYISCIRGQSILPSQNFPTKKG